MRLNVNSIIEQDSRGGKSPSPVDALNVSSEYVASEIIKRSGYGYFPKHQFEDALERMTPERAFALLILATALDDIEPIDSKPPEYLSPTQITELFALQDKARRARIEKQQQLESRLTQERREFFSRYRLVRWAIEGTKARIEKERTRLRKRFERSLITMNSRHEDRDSLNSSVKWFIEERGMVEFWSHMADVQPLRCYVAAENRLRLIGRCSLQLHSIVKELRKARNIDSEYELYPLSRMEDRAMAAMFTNAPEENYQPPRLLGVSYNARDHIWRARVSVKGRNIYVGSYPDQMSAARARDNTIRTMGLSDKLNFPDEERSDT